MLSCIHCNNNQECHTVSEEPTKKRNWFAKHKILTVIGALVLLAIIGSALNSSNSPTVTTTATNSKTASTSDTSSNSSSSEPTQTAKIGSTVNIGGGKGLAVTLAKVIDPATGNPDDDSTPDPGKRFIAIDLNIVNNGTASYQDDANNNVTLIGTDNQSYTADFDNVTECTNFSSGQYTLAAGESTTGCVVFQVPDSVNTAKVQFQTTSGLSSSTGEWEAQ